MTVKTKKMKGLSTRTFNAWIQDLESGQYALRFGGTPHLLTLIETEDTKVWEFDLFGLLLDRIADEWCLDRKSDIHPNTFYYKPMKNGVEMLPEDLGLSPQVMNQLMHLHFEGADGKEVAEFLTTTDLPILADEAL